MQEPEDFEEFYKAAKMMARGARSRRASDLSIGTTSLVHEAWLRVAKRSGSAELRVGYLARVMREVLKDHRKKKNAIKRRRVEAPYGEGGEPGNIRRRISSLLNGQLLSVLGEDPAMVFDLADALEGLEAEFTKTKNNQTAASAVEMAVLLELRTREIAAELGESQTTVARWVRFGKAWLAKTLRKPYLQADAGEPSL